MLKSFQTARSSENGIGLIELMIAVGVSALVLLATTSALILAQNNQFSLVDKLQAEEEVTNVAFPLRHFFSMAVNLVQSPFAGPLNAQTFTANIGQVGTYNLDSWVSSFGAGPVDVIAYFIRENFMSAQNISTASVPVGSARYPITSIFFQQPTINKFGVLYINTSTSTTLLTPQDSDIKLSHLVDFQITEIFAQKFQPAGGAGYAIDNDLNGKMMVTGITMKIVTRNYFNGSERAAIMTWCPPRFMPSGARPDPNCAPNLPYKDNEKSFTFTVRNNVVGRSLTQRGTAANTTGDPADMVAPIFRRPLDSIYFLTPALPIGAISR